MVRAVFVAGSDEPARQAARALKLPLWEDGPAPCEPAIALAWNNGLPSLTLLECGAPGPVCINWQDAAVRRRVGGGRRQPLARAIGLHRQAAVTVLDATGGLGRDGFVLAALGAHVTLCERHPVLLYLLQDAWQRTRCHPKAGAWVAERLAIRAGDARHCLEQAATPFDAIYLDPMYPARNKQALAKKEMRLLRALVGDDDDAQTLLGLARQRAAQRVVVKRPPKAAPLGGQPPSLAYRGKQARYDVYLRADRPVVTS